MRIETDLRVIEYPYSAEGGHSAHRVYTDNDPTRALFPQPHIFTPLIPPTYAFRDTKGQFSMANPPNPHIFGLWEETGASGGNPRGEGANSTQTVTQAWN